MEIIFFRYNNVTLAINHGFMERNEAPLLPYTECAQYSTYKELMDSAARHLEDKEDGKWVCSRVWEHYPMKDIELQTCKQVFNYITYLSDKI